MDCLFIVGSAVVEGIGNDKGNTFKEFVKKVKNIGGDGLENGDYESGGGSCGLGEEIYFKVNEFWGLDSKDLDFIDNIDDNIENNENTIKNAKNFKRDKYDKNEKVDKHIKKVKEHIDLLITYEMKELIIPLVSSNSNSFVNDNIFNLKLLKYNHIPKDIVNTNSISDTIPMKNENETPNLSSLDPSDLYALAFNKNNIYSNDTKIKREVTVLELPSDKTTRLKALLYHLKNEAKSSLSKSILKTVVILDNYEMDRLVAELNNFDQSKQNLNFVFDIGSISSVSINRSKEVTINFLNFN